MKVGSLNSGWSRDAPGKSPRSSSNMTALSIGSLPMIKRSTSLSRSGVGVGCSSLTEFRNILGVVGVQESLRLLGSATIVRVLFREADFREPMIERRKDTANHQRA